MGCPCLGPSIKFNSTISVSIQVNSHKEEIKKVVNRGEKSFQNFSRSLNAKLNKEFSNISSSSVNFSDDDQKDDERENEKNNYNIEIKKNGFNENDADNKRIIY